MHKHDTRVCKEQGMCGDIAKEHSENWYIDELRARTLRLKSTTFNIPYIKQMLHAYNLEPHCLLKTTSATFITMTLMMLNIQCYADNCMTLRYG